MVNNNIIHNVLSSFFALFNAYIYEYRIIDKKVFGNIGWKDEDEKQGFSWVIELEESILIKIMLLCDYLLKHNLTDGDKITIAESELKIKLLELGWNIDEAQGNINYLCFMEIKMIDDGEETDSFFLHF